MLIFNFLLVPFGLVPSRFFQGNLIFFANAAEVLEIAVGAVFALTRFLVIISIRDLVADKSLVTNSGIGGGGQNLILR